MVILSICVVWNTIFNPVFHRLWSAFNENKERRELSLSTSSGYGKEDSFEDEYSDEGCSEYFFSGDDESSIDVFEKYESEVNDDDDMERFSFKNQQRLDDKNQDKKWSKKDDLQLFIRVRRASLEDSSMKYDSRVKSFDWDLIKFQDYSAGDCEARWLFVRKHLKPRKFLDDIIEDAALWYERPWYYNLGLWFNNSEPLYNKFDWGVERIEYTRTITVLSSKDDPEVKLILHQYKPYLSGSA